MNAEQKIRQEIAANGSITIDRFMEICLYDQQVGYYINKNPIGQNSDFITAPEITSLFGKTIALFFIQQIKDNLQKYDKINLIELGAGHGTLAYDILNTLSEFSDIYQMVDYRILDCNIKLVEIQKNKLQNHIDKITWLEKLEDMDSASPIIFVANEFFDCLPIKQYIKRSNNFFERVVVLKNGKLVFSEQPAQTLPEIIDNFSEDYEYEKIIEYSESSVAYINKICEMLKKNKGGALIIDYGYTGFEQGDSLQSISRHKFNDILNNIGNADITSHVNFRLLYYYALKAGIENLTVLNQGDFLRQMGIEPSARKYADKLPEMQKKDLFISLNRLLDSTEMGGLFKCLLIERY